MLVAAGLSEFVEPGAGTELGVVPVNAFGIPNRKPRKAPKASDARQTSVPVAKVCRQLSAAQAKRTSAPATGAESETTNHHEGKNGGSGASGF
jgi:hypothetical protein